MKHSRTEKKGVKRGGPKDDDDSSVDSSGNVRDLIAYSSDSESDTHSELSLTPSERKHLKKTGKLPSRLVEDIRRRPRKAAVKAGERIRRKLAKENRRRISPVTESSDSTYVVKKSRRKQEEEEEEDDGETLGSEDTYTEDEEDESPPRRRKGFQPRKKKSRVVESEEEDDEDEEESPPRRRRGSQKKSRVVESEEEDEEDEDEDEEDDSEYDSEDEQSHASAFNGISISFGPPGGGMEDNTERMIPRRHNMKKESLDVKKFVKLVTKPMEEETIDDQIDQFKAMESPKRKLLLDALEKRDDYTKKEQPLMFRLLQMQLTPDTMGLVMNKYHAMNSMDPSNGEYYKLRSWMEKLVSMPLGIYKEMPVKIDDGSDACVPFMEKAKRCLNEAIYGQEEAKLQILQFIAGKIANPSASGLSLLLVGPPGIGKTSLIKNGIAKALEWPFQFISLGGDSDATTYTGHQFVYEGSHCGKIANCLAQAKSMSMIMMFDELDKISTTSKGEEVQNLLVHLTDPVQNMDFEDKYLSGVPLDLSRAMFVFSGNDMDKIDRVLLDRMVVVRLQGYETKDKITIAEQFLLPGALREVNLVEKVAVTREVLQYVLENYAKEEPGVRELKRCMEQIAQRVNMLRMFNVKELPFHIPGFTLPFVLKKEHVDLFLKKTEVRDKVPFGMYT